MSSNLINGKKKEERQLQRQGSTKQVCVSDNHLVSLEQAAGRVEVGEEFGKVDGNQMCSTKNFEFSGFEAFGSYGKDLK